MRITDEQIDNAIRISWGAKTDIEGLNREFKNFLKIAKILVF